MTRLYVSFGAFDVRMPIRVNPVARAKRNVTRCLDFARHDKKTKSLRRAGVDVDLGNRVKSRIQARVKSTHGPEVLGKIGGFGGLFAPNFSRDARAGAGRERRWRRHEIEGRLRREPARHRRRRSREPLRQRHRGPRRAAALLSRLHRRGKTGAAGLRPAAARFAKACR